MKTRMRALVLLCVAVLLLSACAGAAATDSSSVAEPVHEAGSPLTPLYIYLRGDVSGTGDLIANFVQSTKNTLGIQPVIIGIADEEYDATIAGLIAAGEPVDLVVNKPGNTYYTAAADGAYKELTGTLESGKLNSVLGDDFIQANSMNGHSYGIPLADTYGSSDGAVYRLDMLRRYNSDIELLNSADLLQTFVRSMSNAAVAYTPLLAGENGFGLLNWKPASLQRSGIYPIPGSSYTELPAAVVLSEDGNTVDNVVFAGDDSSIFSALHGFSWNYSYRTDFISSALQANATWTQYASEPVLLNERFSYETFLQNGGTALIADAEIDMRSIETVLHIYDSYAELAFCPSDPAYLQNPAVPASITTDRRAEYILSIPSTSRHSDAALDFINWLYDSQSNYDLFAYGIRGTDWKQDSSGNIISMQSNYRLPAAQLASAAVYKRWPSSMTDKQQELADILGDEELYISSPLAGCVPDVTTDAWQNVTTLYAEAMPALNAGSWGDATADKIAELHATAEGLGLEVLREQIKQDVQAWLDKTADERAANAERAAEAAAAAAAAAASSSAATQSTARYTSQTSAQTTTQPATIGAS